MFGYKLNVGFERKERLDFFMADHTDFARRLRQACEDNPVIPEKGRGQQVWLAQKLDITQEAVRKYFEGINRPRPDKMKHIAKLLGVDESWLALGINPEMDGRQKRQYQNRADAATYIAFGVFMASGYTCAFGREGDEVVDFYAIKGGQQKAISVTTARERSKSVWLLPVKTTYEHTMNIVVVPVRNTQFDFVFMDTVGIAEHGQNRGGIIEIIAHRDSRAFNTGEHVWKRLQDADVL